MAAIGKIRSWGPILATVIGLALFAFIAEEAFRSCESTRNQQRQQVGEVLGKKIDYQEYQKLFDEYSEVMKMTQGRENLTDQEMNQIKDMVWQNYIQEAIIDNEAEKLGLTVTDQELQNMLNEGSDPVLLQSPFVNQQTGRFDANTLKNFLAEYKKAQELNNTQVLEQYGKLYKYWQFIEKNLRKQTLLRKYQELLAGCLLTNPANAQQAFRNQNEESDILLATFPYSSVEDKDVKISDADLKAKYDELKSQFRQLAETRDIKYVQFQVQPSSEDRNTLFKQVEEERTKLATAEDPTEVVRKANSLIAYIGIPQTKAFFPKDIQDRLDSMAVGSTTPVGENLKDHTFNVTRLISKQQMPDSIQYRAIQVPGADGSSAKTADSIYTALKAGADFEALAKKYGQTGEKIWLTSEQYQNAPSLDKDTKKYLDILNTAPTGSYTNLPFAGGNMILQVLDRRAMVTKYLAAVIKKPIDFSKTTYSSAYNKFSQFVSENQTIEAMEKNAQKYGFTVQERKSMSNAEHYVANISSTRDALKWIFDAKKGEVSPLYECGNNDQLLVVAVTNINKKGIQTLDNPSVKDFIQQRVMSDKKAEVLMKKAKTATDLAAAQKLGAKIDTIKQVTFDAPVFIPETGASEPALSGAVFATAKGKVSTPVKGNQGLYVFQVIDKKTRDVKYDEKEAEKALKQKVLQSASQYMRDLYQKADVVDNRYLFF
ncbi:MAG: SurA N-terminal domain-containing protein [Prevotella sp.]|nr:SurA N-terminal domain-containing protein [Prevotella sp.]